MVFITPQEIILLSLMCQWIVFEDNNTIINRDYVKSIEPGYVNIYSNVDYCVPRFCYPFEEEPCYWEETRKELSSRDNIYRMVIANTQNDDRTYNRDRIIIISQEKNPKMYEKIRDYLEKCIVVK